VQNADRVRRILVLLDAATAPHELDQPGMFFLPQAVRPHPVGMTVNWRITFGRKGRDAVEVDLEDYH
jgi:plasmid maintenance system killer protein